MSGSKNQGQTTTKEQAGPPKFQVPYLKDIFGEAQDLYNKDLQSYKGPRLAGFDPAETGWQNALLAYAQGRGSQLSGEYGAATKPGLGFLLSPDQLNAESNPYLKSNAQAVTRNVMQGLTEQALPAVRDEAVMSGGLGSSRTGINEAQAIERSTKAALEANNQLYGSAYGQGLQAMLQAQQLAPEAYKTEYQLGIQPGLTQASVGGQRRAMEQARYDDAQQQFYLEQSLPYIALSQYLGFVGGQYGGQGTATTQQPMSMWDKIFKYGTLDAEGAYNRNLG